MNDECTLQSAAWALGTGNSVVLRGLSITGKRENSNDGVKTNSPNFSVQHPLTEI